MIGWAFDGGRPHPEFDGFVVCEEFQDTLIGKCIDSSNYIS